MVVVGWGRMYCLSVNSLKEEARSKQQGLFLVLLLCVCGWVDEGGRTHTLFPRTTPTPLAQRGLGLRLNLTL